MTLIKNDTDWTQPNNNQQYNTYRDSSQQNDTNHSVTKHNYSQENDIQLGICDVEPFQKRPKFIDQLLKEPKAKLKVNKIY